MHDRLEHLLKAHTDHSEATNELREQLQESHGATASELRTQLEQLQSDLNAAISELETRTATVDVRTKELETDVEQLDREAGKTNDAVRALQEQTNAAIEEKESMHERFDATDAVIEEMKPRVEDLEAIHVEKEEAVRDDFQNELEQLEVTLREEFVAVQMACDKVSRDVARLEGGMGGIHQKVDERHAAITASLDRDGDGVVDKDEFTKWAMEQAQTVSDMEARLAADTVRIEATIERLEGDLGGIRQSADERHAAVTASLDKDGDGVVDKDEFTQWAMEQAQTVSDMETRLETVIKQHRELPVAVQAVQHDMDALKKQVKGGDERLKANLGRLAKKLDWLRGELQARDAQTGSAIPRRTFSEHEREVDEPPQPEVNAGGLRAITRWAEETHTHVSPPRRRPGAHVGAGPARTHSEPSHAPRRELRHTSSVAEVRHASPSRGDSSSGLYARLMNRRPSVEPEDTGPEGNPKLSDMEALTTAIAELKAERSALLRMPGPSHVQNRARTVASHCGSLALPSHCNVTAADRTVTSHRLFNTPHACRRPAPSRAR